MQDIWSARAIIHSWDGVDAWQNYTVCPRSSDPFYIVTYYIKWVTTSRADGNMSVPVPLLWFYKSRAGKDVRSISDYNCYRFVDSLFLLYDYFCAIWESVIIFKNLE